MEIPYFKQVRQTVRDKSHIVARQVTEHINPILATHDGFAYFETDAEDSRYRILALRRKHMLLGRQTLIAINQERSPKLGEEFFPDGRILHMTDLMVGESHNPFTRAEYDLDYVQETQACGQHDHQPLTPAKTTLILPENDGLHVYGNLKRNGLSLYAHSTNWTSQHTERLAEDNATLTGITRAIMHCNRHNLKKEYTDLSD